MPSRLLREGILDSEAVNSLSFAAEVFYRRLMSVVDDFGRFDGRPSVLRGRLYALKLDTVREADISRWIAECEKAGLIVLYAVGEKPYILFRKLGSPRAKESKFPAPSAQPEIGGVQHTSVNGCAQMKTDADICAQMKTDVPGSYSGTGSYSGAGSGCGPDGTNHPTGTDGDSAQTAPGPTPERVRSAWNRQAGVTPCQTLGVHRERIIRQWATGNPLWVAHWESAIEFVGRTPAYCGENRDHWRADLTWFLKDQNFAQVVDKMLAARDATPAKRPPTIAEFQAKYAKPATEGGTGGGPA